MIRNSAIKEGASMQKAFVWLAGAGLLAAGCAGESPASTEPAFREIGSAIKARQVTPLPIPGGDYIDAAPHHRAGIIHQFVPGPTEAPFLLDGIWAEPNGITNFNGTVA